MHIHLYIYVSILKEKDNLKFKITAFKLYKNLFFFLNLKKFTVLQKQKPKTQTTCLQTTAFDTTEITHIHNSCYRRTFS